MADEEKPTGAALAGRGAPELPQAQEVFNGVVTDSSVCGKPPIRIRYGLYAAQAQPHARLSAACFSVIAAQQ